MLTDQKIYTGVAPLKVILFEKSGHFLWNFILEADQKRSSVNYPDLTFSEWNVLTFHLEIAFCFDIKNVLQNKMWK